MTSSEFVSTMVLDIRSLAVTAAEKLSKMIVVFGPGKARARRHQKPPDVLK